MLFDNFETEGTSYTTEIPDVYFFLKTRSGKEFLWFVSDHLKTYPLFSTHCIERSYSDMRLREAARRYGLDISQ